MRYYIVISILVLFIACGSVKKIIVEENSKEEFTGIITMSKLLKEPYRKWFKSRYEAYQLDDSLKISVQKYFRDVKIKAFIGLWCSDSKREIPSLLKIVKEGNISEKNIEIIAVNHKKKAKGLEKGFTIFRVPTFIFYKNNKELGRFVELPQETLEQDILKIITGKPYKHFYQK
ncbi:thioredoxin family protein [Tenacibaculum finnmarkense]|uniref:thioredoxin family protein n=1 Tax=Tenacibaculum finnmarkense TaxID=2781243 RepID=UPI00187BADE8|nr:thioredoxin family protein [Tenacibaculum finnmarkense]MBE7693515.1 thioredoxin [Tenacibaculum finnmarkense genomovar finnmarkense]MCD8447894.1 thioredoxin family protein [Tenacibaculum finnmarkense genomovar finnmarkense]MCG8806207.1 thioredoxin family protein [Tenacibaculum finnmarkense]MCG8857332.1 thioredoxin family protein [Tenacibaculum finnmarkense]